MSIPTSSVGGLTSLISREQFTNDLWAISGPHSPLESPSGSLSALDLKAPGKARREFEKGYQFLMRKDHQGAVQHLTIATAIYPSFVSAHNALGTAYLGLGQNDQARAEFSQAVSLDDHLPNSYLNLGCAELALKHYSAAQESIQKASALAPLDLQLLTALAYGQLMNQDYLAAITTAHQVHDRKHQGAALVHLYAAAAWEAQNQLPEALYELQTLLGEDPKSTAAVQAHQMMEEIKQEQSRPPAPEPRLHISFTEVPSDASSDPADVPARIRRLMQASKENAQIVEAEAEGECTTCGADESLASAEAAPAEVGIAPNSSSHPKAGSKNAGLTFRASTDEVAVFFAATDHGKSVTNLTGEDVGIRDDSRAPAVITGFRNESQLPLRMGLVIDTSASISDRFRFEKDAATSFVQKVMTGQNDLAFVIGFANSVLLVQDFTADQKLISHAIGQLAPCGGTALWDAVAFAADKLATQSEAQPVARILVVISDGEDNSSTATFKQAINRAQHGGVVVYTVSTREDTNTRVDSLVGEHALKTLADLTGGATFAPGSARHLNGTLADLQHVIRSRYLVSYKPVLFKRDGRYHAIDITVEKGGHKLRVYARKGYYADEDSAGTSRF
ncbi:MAG TPA: VWA domain-containing protein [Terriglobales bacterium]|nr:VWA domain-containing protein [Terriglobales bacterium]